MHNYREHEMHKVKARLRNSEKQLWVMEQLKALFPFPNSVSDDISPVDRFIIILSRINVDGAMESLLEVILHLAYDCYLLDVYHRGLIGHFLLASY